MNNNDKVLLQFEINKGFLEEINLLISGQDDKKIEPIEHFRNALLLYAQIVEGVHNGKTPALIDENYLSATKMELPDLLILLKHAKESQGNTKNNNIIDLTSNML